MTLPGFTECETCRGKGRMFIGGSDEPCLAACQGTGLQPNPAIVEAVVGAVGSVAPDDYPWISEEQARDALLAYAREVGE